MLNSEQTPLTLQASHSSAPHHACTCSLWPPCSTAVGTIEFRSLLEPVRVANPFVDFFEANCDRIDLEGKVAYCTSKNS